MKLSHSKAYTLVEVVVASVIFMTTVTAIFATIALTRNPVVQSEHAINASLYGKAFLASLRSQVRADTWDTGANLLRAGTRAIPANPAYPGYSGNYTVTDQGANLGRRVTLNITTP